MDPPLTATLVIPADIQQPASVPRARGHTVFHKPRMRPVRGLGIAVTLTHVNGSVGGEERGVLDGLRPPAEDDAAWAGPLARLLRAPGVTDVLVHRPREAWVDRGLGLERVDVALADADAVRSLAVRLAAAGGQRLDDASPVADARLPDGNRLHAVLPPVAPGCAAISVRVVRSQALTLADLAASGAIDAPTAALLARMVRARLSVLVCGATGSGKTTLMASLLSLAAPHERIVVIEEAGEIAPAHPHVVRLVERRANVEGAGAVGLARLVREALRMRPDRVVLGECRGAELREVLSAFNTGHRGGMTTIHANSPRDVPVRLATLGALAGMPAAAVAAQAAAGFDVVLHVSRAGGVRRLTDVCVLRASDTSLHVVPAWVWGGDGRWRAGPAWGELRAALGESGPAQAAADAVA